MKPIFISDQEKEKLIKEFTESLDSGLYDGSLSFTKSYIFDAKTRPNATIVYTPEAYAKTIMLLSKFNSEVGWHALVKRGVFHDEYVIYDVIVYPQQVTGATVNTDDAGYAKFMIDLTDEQAEFMHAQCHSHVNMDTSPSTVDRHHQEGVLKCMNNEGFYIFQIWNKRLECTSFIYDFDHNIMYESKDIDLEIMDENHNYLSDFIADAKTMVVTKAAVPAQSTYQKPSYAWTPGANSVKNNFKKTKPKSALTDMRGLDDDDDDNVMDWPYSQYGSYYSEY